MSETLVILLPMLTIGLLTFFFLRSRRPRKAKKTPVDDRTRLERSVWAWAKILSAEAGTVSSLGVARVEMQLEVHTPGTPAYPAKVTWLVDRESLEFVEQGKELSLKVDPQDLKYIYPNGSWAKVVN
ncbi:MAG TPA: hypothetical protein VMC09_10010 [Anaerolineales bacterium]|nr:hypothetical protein [Anaerolineales bacterium]